MAKKKPKSLDERLEFLVQSTESLHANLEELHAITAEHTRQLTEHTRRIELQEKRWERFDRALRAGLQAWLNENGDEDSER